MGLFGRRRSEDRSDGSGGPSGSGAPASPELDPRVADIEEDDGRILRPTTAPVGPEDLARIATGIAALREEGVDVDDLLSIGGGYDRAYAAWVAAPVDHRPDEGDIVRRYAVAIGEHLSRHTDLDWQVVTDMFGTDLAVAGGFSGAFSVVPNNLVGARWMRGETGWIPGVVGHLVRLRTRR